MDPCRKLCKLTGEAIGRFRMIGDGDRVLVGLSGGKDSFALLHVLHELRRRAPVRFEVIAATFDPGFPEFNLEGIRAYCRERNWEHHTVSLPIAQILEEKRFTGAPCVLCSRLRRGKLSGLAAELGCGKLAFRRRRRLLSDESVPGAGVVDDGAERGDERGKSPGDPTVRAGTGGADPRGGESVGAAAGGSLSV